MISLKYNVILASNSPRRKELLSSLDIQHEVKVFPDIEESYPETLQKEDVAEYLAKKKGKSYLNSLKEKQLIITADTIILSNDQILGKPKNMDEAKQMLQQLSGKTHKVVTGVCLLSKDKQKSFSCTSEVKFTTLDENEIIYYAEKYNPLDKAGAYGIQEWIGHIAVEYISGSYFNIMGLPTHQLYYELKHFDK